MVTNGGVSEVRPSISRNPKAAEAFRYLSWSCIGVCDCSSGFFCLPACVSLCVFYVFQTGVSGFLGFPKPYTLHPNVYTEALNQGYLTSMFFFGVPGFVKFPSLNLLCAPRPLNMKHSRHQVRTIRTVLIIIVIIMQIMTVIMVLRITIITISPL